MENSQEDIKVLNNKLVELTSKLIKIQYRLDTITPLGKNHESTNKVNTTESIEQGPIQISKWTDK
jgi:hypothetical protein